MEGVNLILSHLHKHLPGLFLPNHQIPHLPLPPLERRSQLAVERTRARAVRGALEDLERGEELSCDGAAGGEDFGAVDADVEVLERGWGGRGGGRGRGWGADLFEVGDAGADEVLGYAHADVSGVGL